MPTVPVVSGVLVKTGGELIELTLSEKVEVESEQDPEPLAV